MSYGEEQRKRNQEARQKLVDQGIKNLEAIAAILGEGANINKANQSDRAVLEINDSPVAILRITTSGYNYNKFTGRITIDSRLGGYTHKFWRGVKAKFKAQEYADEILRLVNIRNEKDKAEKITQNAQREAAKAVEKAGLGEYLGYGSGQSISLRSTSSGDLPRVKVSERFGVYEKNTALDIEKLSNFVATLIEFSQRGEVRINLDISVDNLPALAEAIKEYEAE